MERGNSNPPQSTAAPLARQQQHGSRRGCSWRRSHAFDDKPVGRGCIPQGWGDSRVTAAAIQEPSSKRETGARPHVRPVERIEMISVRHRSPCLRRRCPSTTSVLPRRTAGSGRRGPEGGVLSQEPAVRAVSRVRCRPRQDREVAALMRTAGKRRPEYRQGDARSSSQGSMTAIPQCSKSAPLRVATAASLARAMAAIWQSASRIGRPTERREATIVA